MLDLGVLLQELVDCVLLDITFLLAVDLIAHQDEGELFGFLGRPLVEEFSDPGLDVVEGLPR